MTVAVAEQIQHLPDIEQFEREPLAEQERCLTEVDNLNRHRQADGSHARWVLDDVLKNLIPFVKEGGIPNAVHKVEHPYQEIT